jgi:hypothetical protein
MHGAAGLPLHKVSSLWGQGVGNFGLFGRLPSRCPVVEGSSKDQAGSLSPRDRVCETKQKTNPPLVARATLGKDLHIIDVRGGTATAKSTPAQTRAIANFYQHCAVANDLVSRFLLLNIQANEAEIPRLRQSDDLLTILFASSSLPLPPLCSVSPHRPAGLLR